MSNFRHVLFLIASLLTLIKSTCWSPIIEQKQDKNLKRLSDETIVERMSADLAKDLLSLDVYKFSQGPYNYFILDDFGVENIEHKLIRIPENPQTYLYEGRDSLDLEKNFVEIQSFKIVDRTFTKRFYYLEDYEFDFISRKALSINENENGDTFNKILALFQLEFEYKDKLIDNETKHKSSKVLRSYPSSFFSVNDQALLDTYLQTANIHTLNTLNSSAGDNSKHITMDDPIVTLIPKGAFAVIDTKKIAGEEWGYYLKTTPYDSYLIKAEVFLFDICSTYPSNDNFLGTDITPVINEVYFYNSYTDLVYYVQDNNLCIYKPSYAATITYVDEYGWFYNDYDETEYYVTKQHQPNPGESEYDPFNDFGCFFEDQYILLEGAKPIDLAEILHSTFKFILDSSSFIFNFLNLHYSASLIGNNVISCANFINDYVYDFVSNQNQTSRLLTTDKATGIISFDYSPDRIIEEALVPFLMKDKFIGFTFECDKVIFKNSNHHIKFYDRIKKREGTTSDYRTLFSQKIVLPLGRESILGMINVETIDCEVSYLWSPLFQTSDISNQDFGKRTHVSLSATGKKFRFEKRLEPGSYILKFDSLPRLSTINFSNGRTVFTGLDERDLFEKSASDTKYFVPIIPEYDVNLNISAPTNFYFEICPFLDDQVVDYSFDFVLLKQDEAVDTNEYLSSFEIINLDLQCASHAQLIKFIPRASALYTFYGFGAQYGCTLSILDSQGRPLIENQSCNSSFLDMYLLSKNKVYYISYKSYFANGSIHLRIFKNRYIEPCPSQYAIYGDYYRYPKYDSSIQCFLFRPMVNVEYKISSTSNSQEIAIYNLAGNKLAKNRSNGTLTFSFLQNQTYLIYIDFLLRDLNVLRGVCLKLEVR